MTGEWALLVAAVVTALLAALQVAFARFYGGCDRHAGAPNDRGHR